MTAQTAASTQETDPPSYDVIVIGAGFAGLYMLYRLAALGLRIRGYEAGSGVGGTWFWNRYPGARCDVESLEYSYSFSNELQQDWRWSHRYAEQPEILRYINHVADRFDLRRHIVFNTRIQTATFDEARQRWELRTDSGETVTARFCVMATGNLSVPRTPDFVGIENFQGQWYHTGQWPAEGVDFTGKRVALIGTGATGIQLVPKIAATAAQLYVFQRTANFSVPARNRPIDNETDSAHKATYPQRRLKAIQSSIGVSNCPTPIRSALELSAEERERVYEKLWQQGGSTAFLSAFRDLVTDREANATAAEFVRNKIRSIVRDPATAELLAPKDHPIGTKRLCVDSDYYETFNRENVTLVDIRSAPLREITPTGLRTARADYKADIIVFATGFDAMTGALSEMDLHGRGGLALRDKWQYGPTTYLGLMIAGFPNLFLVTGPGSPSVKSNMVCSIEQHVDWIAQCLAYLEAEGFAAIEATEKAEQGWVAHVNEVADSTLFPLADSWYVGSNIPGKPRVFMPYVGGIPAYRRVCDEIVAAGYRGFAFTPSADTDAAETGQGKVELT